MGLPWVLCYLWVPSGKGPEALRMRVEPMSMFSRKTLILASSVTRRSTACWDTAGEHVVLSSVDYQLNWKWGCVYNMGA